MGLVILIGFPLLLIGIWRSVSILVLIVMTRPPDSLSRERERPRFRQTKIATERCSVRIALLYLTCDDFDPKACETLLEQKDVMGDVFILDDSELPWNRMEIDRWAAGQSVHIEIVRRSARKEFKSGSLNNWLQLFGRPEYFPFFLLVDSGIHLPQNFVSVLLDHLELSRLAFVQGSHCGDRGTGDFQRLFSRHVDCAWRYEIPAQCLTGITPMLGHGALIRTSIAQEIGGFPNFISEDLAFTLKLAACGKFGALVNNAVASEGYPFSYRSHWCRLLRWAQGDTDLVLRLFYLLIVGPLRPLRKAPFGFRLLQVPAAALYWPLLVVVSSLTLAGAENGPVLCPLAWIAMPLMLTPVIPALAFPGTGFAGRIWFVLASGFLAAATTCVPIVGTLQVFLGRSLRWQPTESTTQPPIDLRWIALEVLTGGLAATTGVVSHDFMLGAVGAAIYCSPIMRTRCEMLALQVGTTAFWGLVVWQVILDTTSGRAPVSHLMLLLGITVIV